MNRQAGGNGTNHNYSRVPVNSSQWNGRETMMASTSSTWNQSEMEDNSSPDMTKDEDGDAKKRRRIQQACKICSLRRVKVS
jgi:hypothetical protein